LNSGSLVLMLFPIEAEKDNGNRCVIASMQHSLPDSRFSRNCSRFSPFRARRARLHVPVILTGPLWLISPCPNLQRVPASRIYLHHNHRRFLALAFQHCRYRQTISCRVAVVGATAIPLREDAGVPPILAIKGVTSSAGPFAGRLGSATEIWTLSESLCGPRLRRRKECAVAVR
jgi:hypothetical protein